jgi:propionyl-CoA carboxylase alpha chain
LLGNKIIEVAKIKCRHSYILAGFLSENADFAEECEKNNIILLVKSEPLNYGK